MPNNITNRIKITGPKDIVKKIVDFCRGDEEQQVHSYNGELALNPFDFDKIVPQTESVRKSIEDPTWYPKGYMDDWKPRFKGDRPFEYWYEWRLQHWGTKWNSYDPSVDEDGSDGKWIVWFDTAWSPPIPVVNKLALRFPGVYIDHRWADEDTGYNCGIRKYRLFFGKVQVREKDMKGHRRWCRRVQNRRIGND